MAHRLIKQATSTYLPAVKEVIAQPAHFDVVFTLSAVTKYSPGTKPGVPIPVYGPVSDASGRTSQQIIGYTSTQVPSGTPYVVYEQVPTYIYRPAISDVQGRDATVVTDNQPGWNAGAHSSKVVDGDFEISFSLPRSDIGALVGLAVPGSTNSFNGVEHGVLLTSAGSLTIVESGAPRDSSVASEAVVPIRIVRRNNVVTSYVGSDFSYISSIPSYGPKVLSAVLYAATDFVDDPTISGIVFFQSRDAWDWGDGLGLIGLQARSGWDLAGSATIGDGSGEMSFDLTMNALDADRTSGHMVMDVPTLTATAGFIDVEANGVTVNIPISMLSMAIEVDIGSTSSVFDLTMHSADYNYGDASIVLNAPDVFGLSTEEPVDTSSWAEASFFGDFYSVDRVLFALIHDGLSIGDSFDLLLSMDADLAEHLMLYSDSSATMLIQALLTNGIQVSNIASSAARTLLQYVTNLASGAVGRYQGYDFDGFCRIGMQTFGFKPNGLYRLGAPDDNGTLISALIDFAADSFGTTQGKRVGNVFLGLGTDGQVFVRTTEDNDIEMTYRAYQRKSEFRADMQRGRASRFWRMRIEIVDASFAELDNVEWALAATGRRT
ncbi:hypothetical protein ACVBEG_03205 [Pseudomonas sp. GG8]